MPTLILALVVSLFATSCSKPAGSVCAIEDSGFTARDACASQCLDRWAVTCPDGEVVKPKVCAGRQSCQVGGCPNGQACYHFDDPFNEVSYCIPDTVCGAAPSPANRALWERSARDRAADTRARFRKPTTDAPRTEPIAK